PMLTNLYARPLGRDAHSLRELAVVDLVILGRKQRAGDFPGKPWLARPSRRRREPFERQIELPLKFQMMRDRRLIVGGQRKNDRALAAQFDIDAACALKLFRKGRPALLAFAPKRDECFRARLRLAASRQHAGSGTGCARASLAAIEYRDGRARSEPPGNAKPDHAGADDDDAGHA